MPVWEPTPSAGTGSSLPWRSQQRMAKGHLSRVTPPREDTSWGWRAHGTSWFVPWPLHHVYVAHDDDSCVFVKERLKLMLGFEK